MASGQLWTFRWQTESSPARDDSDDFQAVAGGKLAVRKF